MKLNKKLNYEQILEWLKKNNIDANDLDAIFEGYYEHFDNNEEDQGNEEKASNKKELLKKLGEVKLVNTYGGGEGGGENVVRVYFFKDHNVFIRYIGYYSSYNGTDWNYPKIKEVFPKSIRRNVFISEGEEALDEELNF